MYFGSLQLKIQLTVQRYESWKLLQTKPEDRDLLLSGRAEKQTNQNINTIIKKSCTNSTKFLLKWIQQQTHYTHSFRTTALRDQLQPFSFCYGWSSYVFRLWNIPHPAIVNFIQNVLRVVSFKIMSCSLIQRYTIFIIM